MRIGREQSGRRCVHSSNAIAMNKFAMNKFAMSEFAMSEFARARVPAAPPVAGPAAAPQSRAIRIMFGKQRPSPGSRPEAGEQDKR